MWLKYSKKNPSFSKTFNNKKHLGFSYPGNCIFFLHINKVANLGDQREKRCTQSFREKNTESKGFC